MKAIKGFYHFKLGSVKKGDPLPDDISDTLKKELASFYSADTEEKAAPRPKNKARQKTEDK